MNTGKLVLFENLVNEYYPSLSSPSRYELKTYVHKLERHCRHSGLEDLSNVITNKA